MASWAQNGKNEPPEASWEPFGQLGPEIAKNELSYVQNLVKYEAFGAPTAQNLVKYEAFGAPIAENLVKYEEKSVPWGLPDGKVTPPWGGK